MYSAFQSYDVAALVVFLFELQIIISFHSSFWCKDRNNRGIENWGIETVYV